MSKVVSITTFASESPPAEQPPRRLDPVQLGHAHVHQDDVRLQSTAPSSTASSAVRRPRRRPRGPARPRGSSGSRRARAPGRRRSGRGPAGLPRRCCDARPGGRRACARRPRTACARASAAAGTTPCRPWIDELVDAHRPVEVLQPMRAEVVRRAGQLLLLVLEQRPGRLRDAGSGRRGRRRRSGRRGGRPARGTGPPASRRLARVHADPHATAASLRPRVRRPARAAPRPPRRRRPAAGGTRRRTSRPRVDLPPAASSKACRRSRPCVASTSP